MKPEIKAWLPELQTHRADLYDPETEVIDPLEFQAWLDKLTEGADKIYLHGTRWEHFYGEGASHEALLICPREIEKQTPLEIAVEALQHYVEHYTAPSAEVARKALEALAKIEAAK